MSALSRARLAARLTRSARRMLLEWFKACACRGAARGPRGRERKRRAPIRKGLCAPFRRKQRHAASPACSLAPSLLPRARARARPRRALAAARLADKVEDEARGPEAGGIWLGARFEDCEPAGGAAVDLRATVGGGAAVDLRATVVPAFETVCGIGSRGARARLLRPGVKCELAQWRTPRIRLRRAFSA